MSSIFYLGLDIYHKKPALYVMFPVINLLKLFKIYGLG